jgi:hypothetical protein
MNRLMIGDEGMLIKLTKGENTLVFNQRLKTKEGFVYGIKMVPVLNQVAITVVETKGMIKTMSFEINKLHKTLQNFVRIHLKAVGTSYGIKVFGSIETCKSCVIVNVKEKKTNTKIWS